MNCKYKVGDKVIISDKIKVGSTYNDGCLVTFMMKEYIGREATIIAASKVGGYGEDRYRLDITKDNWSWSNDMLTPATPRYQPTEMIIITTDGHETRGYHKRNGKVIAESKCIRNEADEHDFHVAANLVVDRLFEKKEQPEEFYNGRVFIEIYEPDWLPVEIPDHHIFDVKDGYFSGFSGDNILKNKRFRTLEEIAIFFDDAVGVYEVEGEVHV